MTLSSDGQKSRALGCFSRIMQSTDIPLIGAAISVWRGSLSSARCSADESGFRRLDQGCSKDSLQLSVVLS